MKLQKQKTDYQRGYHKYVIVLPNEVVETSGFQEGNELTAEAKKGEIKLIRMKRKD
jgi:antitoxin component of MazEF toxin-antitoxin module